jgi:S-adenosyl methyltransferase
MAVQSRQFLIRAVRYLASEAGIRQFLDIGTGLPTMQNTHEVAQQVAPESKIVYVDNDPLVLVHARALLRNTTPEGVTAYLDADFNDPDMIIADARNVLNFNKPIGVMFMGVLGHVASCDDARSIVGRVMDAVPSGSYLVLWDGNDTTRPMSTSARPTRRPEGCPTSPAATSRSASASKVWKWWTRAWCRSPSGGQPLANSARTSPLTPPTAPWHASRKAARASEQAKALVTHAQHVHRAGHSEGPRRPPAGRGAPSSCTL